MGRAAIFAGYEFALRRAVLPLEEVIVGERVGAKPLQASVKMKTRRFERIADRDRGRERDRDDLERDLQLARLEQRAEAAERANTAKSAFLASVSHETRTPLNGVLGVTELLMGTELSSHQSELVQMIQRSAEGLLAILNDLLDLSKVEANRLDLEEVEFDVRETVEDVAALFASPARTKGISVVCSIERGTHTWRRGDPKRFRQVVTNLLSNAIKFTQQGHVLVRVSSPQVDPDVMLVTVEDTGIGMRPEAVAHVFEPYAQADRSVARLYGGTGLGLTIVKQLCELMGGNVLLKSEVGKGSTFRCRIPLPCARTPQHVEEPMKAVRAELSNKRALVVHRSSAVAEALIETLADVDIEAFWLRPEETPTSDFGFDLCYFEDDGDGALVERMIASEMVLIPISKVADPKKQKLVEPVRQKSLVNITRSALGLEHDDRFGVSHKPAGAVSVTPFHRTVHVLLVDDNEINRQIGAAMLKTLRCEVELATNGREACERCEAKRYDIVVMDCDMPEMDGLAATREIRRRETAAREAGYIVADRLPIIALTANAGRSDRDNCLDAGMDDFVTKPFRRADLRIVMGRLLERSATESITIVMPRQERTEAASVATPNASDASDATDATDASEENASIDVSLLATLRDTAGSELVDEMILLYEKTAPEMLEQLRAARAADAPTLVASLAHKLNGSSRALGAMDVATELDAIERGAKQCDLTILDARADALERAMRRSIELLRRQISV